MALGLALAALPACTLLEAPEERDAPPDLVFANISLNQYKHGRLEARARFDELRHHTRERRAEGNGMEWEPLDGAGKPEGVLTAGVGTTWLDRSFAHLREGIVWKAVDGTRLETASADVDLSARTANGVESTTLTGDGFVSRAPGFSAQGGEDGWLRLEGGVVSELDSPDSPKAAESTTDSPTPAVAPAEGEER